MPSCRDGLLLLPLVLALIVVPVGAAPPVPSDHAQRLEKGKDLFTKQVRAVLVENCLKCHGGEKVRGGLDLATREGLLKGGDNGTAVVPFDANESRLMKLVRHADMPNMPPAGNPKLPEAALAKLAEWIDLGAPYDKPLVEKATAPRKEMVVTDEDRKFWSFQPLTRPAPPAVKDAAWCKTPIDKFILAKLEAKGITPNTPADRRKLIRRAYFDVIGLPPSPEEVEAFVKDDSPQAWEKVIDRLLASPHYGERWGRHWLDIVRFGESHGFEHDYDRPTAYHYRDFVIKALNQDLPYDTFVRWQLAGDEVAPDNPLAMRATGYLAAGVHSTQITANLVEKERYDELDDILRTTGTAMLGLTIGCARCHDHKYDPIPTRDYYRMLSTFTTTVRSEVDLELDPAAARAEREKFEAELKVRLGAREKYEREELGKHFDAWLTKGDRGPQPRWWTLDVSGTKSEGGATFTKQADGSLLLGGANPDHDTWTLTTKVDAGKVTAVRLETLAHPSLVKGGPGRATNGNFALTEFRVTAKPLAGDKPAVALKLKNPKATFEQRGLPVAAAIDDNKTTGWAVDPQFGKDHAAVFEVDGGLDGPAVLTFTLEFKNNTGHGIARPRLSVTTGTLPVPLDGDAAPQAIAPLWGKDNLTETERATFLAWFRTTEPGWRKLNDAVEAHRAAGPKPATVKALISSEGVKPLRLHTQGADFFNETYFLKRGDPNQKDGIATQGFLQVLSRNGKAESHWQEKPPTGSKLSYRRKSLANWLTDVDSGAGHLLARVIVNRVWQHHFGRGIVATPGDFGFQGDKPSHPELLDYLASSLIDGGWRLKPLHKQVLLSAAYQVDSARSRDKAARDPENVLCWRWVPRRLEAEMVRDNMLATSGTLDAKMFGPGTLDETQKRRSIYFFQKRSKLIPSMVLFDAPDLLQGIDVRPSTTVAPQALLLLNGKLVRDCADALAKRVGEKEDPVTAAYVTALGRPPHRDELAAAREFLKEEAASYTAAGKPDAQRRALADFCQVLLGLNEFVYVD